MRLTKLHPIAGFTVLALACTTAAPVVFLLSQGAPLSSSLPPALLSAPFLLMLMGHASLCRTWRRNAFIAAGNLPLLFAWGSAIVLMWYSQAGWLGIVGFGGVLCLMVSLYLWLSLVITEPPSPRPGDSIK